MRKFRKNTSKIIVSWLIGFWLGNIATNAQDLASMPYRHLIKMAQGEKVDAEAKSYQMRISSNIGVSPEEIELLLYTGETPLHLIVDDKGNFDVPNTVNLFAENPMLVANQPKGTLNISFKLEVPPFQAPKIEDGKIQYTKLFGPVIEMQNQVRRIDPTFGLMGKDQFALVIRTDQPIKIHRTSGEGDKAIKGTRTYHPKKVKDAKGGEEKKGVIVLIMEAYMFEDDPVVEIPGKIDMEIKPVSSADAENYKSAY
jgi:hypothetical protein